LDVALPPLCRRSGPDLSTSFVGSLGDAPRRSSLPPLLPRREPSEPAALQTSSASRETPPSSCRCSRDWSDHDSLRTRGGERYHPVAVRRDGGGNTLLSSPIPSRKGADPHRDDPIRKSDRRGRPITRSDQETMGPPMIFLSHRRRSGAVIEHQFPTSGGGDAPMASPPPPGVGGMRAGARVQLLVGVVTDLLVRMSTKLLASSPCGLVFEFVRTFGDGKGSALGGPLSDLRLLGRGDGI